MCREKKAMKKVKNHFIFRPQEKSLLKYWSLKLRCIASGEEITLFLIPILNNLFDMSQNKAVKAKNVQIFSLMFCFEEAVCGVFFRFGAFVITIRSYRKQQLILFCFSSCKLRSFVKQM